MNVIFSDKVRATKILIKNKLPMKNLLNLSY